MVRCGIALYGGDPMNTYPRAHGLVPALSLRPFGGQPTDLDLNLGRASR